jgi:hypothetical protein
MRCSICGSENRGTAKFCDKCGARLSLNRSSCGSDNCPDTGFCDACGAALGAHSTSFADITIGLSEDD